MTKETTTATDNMANELKSLMVENSITAYQLEKSGLPKHKIYSVLRMGKVQKPNYTIDTLISVLEKLELQLQIKKK